MVTVIQLLGRKFIVPTDTSFIVREIPKKIQEGEILKVKCLKIDSSTNKIEHGEIEIIAKKVLKNKITIFKKKRRKRYTKTIGYKQYTAYFRLVQNNN